MTEKRQLPLPEGEEFFILSIKEPVNTTYMVWWRSNNCGYTYVIDQAGRYSRQQVLDNLNYYHDGWNTLAVPCEVAEKEAVRICMFENPLVRMINDARQESGYRDMLKNQAAKEEAYKQKELEELKEELKYQARLKAIGYDKTFDEERWEKLDWDPDAYEYTEGYGWHKRGCCEWY